MFIPRNMPTERPATVVTPMIKIEGTQIPGTILVDSITIRKEVNRIAWAKVVIIDGDSASGSFPASEGDTFLPGKAIEISGGYESDHQILFKGVIITHGIKVRANGTSLVVIECRDNAVKMTIGRKSKYFVEMTDSEIFSSIAGQYSGITLTAESTRVNHKAMVQYEVTDWDFMVTRAEANGKICQVSDNTLEIKAPQPQQSPVLSLLYGATILEFDAEFDARHQLKKATARGWNYSEQQLDEAEGSDPGVSTAGNLSAGNLAKVVSPDDFTLGNGGKPESQEMQAWSDAFLLKRQLSKVRGRVKCKGTHLVKPGDVIGLGGLGDRFNGNVFVSAIQHFMAAGDWQTDIQFGMNPEWFAEKAESERASAGGLVSSVQGLQSAVVTQIENDPSGDYRVKVKIPLISPDEEGTWARIATLDAGNNRGSFFRPEVGDEVIVGFINNDPRHAVILGMVHSSALSAPLEAESSNPKKGFVTRSGLKLMFDDEKKSITLTTPAGKKIMIGDSAGKVKVSDDLGNTMEMSSDGITLESAMNLELKAGGTLTLEANQLSISSGTGLSLKGGASTEISSSGSLTVKGSIVQIN